ncbi:FMN reductase [Amycolatopsis regifaucium]|uniref:NADPH-dependent FMN reductase n=1 Tax=Amycolatopsis regifaucium TaxID=546365 RepID=A0A154MSU4_9PSEU|nr:FMN reductase [Amycolatopsis regifaucium]KZB86857.1 NADPH-dependent FMN reductase [Amycolatopsis regifaucium]OKA09288.1 NADPH-dependent FMN reductase [Amycolatopsis regifaucium]SFH57604.1 FMN reductase [Amycolatopsis regifaucium]
MTTIAVVTAGLSQPSSTRLLADKLAAAVSSALPDVQIDVIELRDLAIDVTKNMLTGFPSPALRAAIDTVTAADGLIAVTPVFTASYSGLFKSFFDVLDPKALDGKPVLIGATGGTERHSLVLDFALRPLFAYLRAEPVATAVYAASSDWASPGDLDTRASRAGREFASRLSREGTVAAPASGFVPFEQLLRAGE